MPPVKRRNHFCSARMSTGGPAPKRQSATQCGKPGKPYPYEDQPEVAEDASLSSNQNSANRLLEGSGQLSIGNEDPLSRNDDDTVEPDDGDPLSSDDEIVSNEKSDGGSDDGTVDYEPDDDTIKEEQ
jgi:hypothetical protein